MKTRILGKSVITPQLSSDREYRVGSIMYPRVSTVIDIVGTKLCSSCNGPASSWEPPEEPTTVGNNFHDFAEMYMNGTATEAEWPTLHSLSGLMKKVLKLIKFPAGTRFYAELPVFSEAAATAGTIDLVLERDGYVDIVDYKTGVKKRADGDQLRYYMAILHSAGVPVKNATAIYVDVAAGEIREAKGFFFSESSLHAALMIMKGAENIWRYK